MFESVCVLCAFCPSSSTSLLNGPALQSFTHTHTPLHLLSYRQSSDDESTFADALSPRSSNGSASPLTLDAILAATSAGTNNGGSRDGGEGGGGWRRMRPASGSPAPPELSDAGFQTASVRCVFVRMFVWLAGGKGKAEGVPRACMDSPCTTQPSTSQSNHPLASIHTSIHPPTHLGLRGRAHERQVEQHPHGP